MKNPRFSFFNPGFIIFLTIFASSAVFANAETDADTFNRYCSPADNVNWVKGKDECLRIITLKDEQSPSPETLLIYLHGDSPRGGPTDYLKYRARRIKNKNAIHVILLRPGYYDEEEFASTGTSHRKARIGTSYNAHNVQEIAKAIEQLKAHHKTKQAFIIGHSGGAAIAALIMGKHPKVADGAILAACPWNLPRWGEMVGKKTGKGALSPHDYIEKVDQDARILALTGSEDDNTFPVLAKEYVEELKKRNINASFSIVEGKDHNGVIRSTELLDAIIGLLNTKG